MQKLWIKLLCLFLTLSHLQAKAFYNGSCSSQGEWVSAALTQAESIRQAVENLRNDPNCTGIESAIQKLDATREAGNKSQSHFLQSYSQLNREIRDLRMMSAEGNSDFQQRVTDILMNRVVDEADVASKSGRMFTANQQKEVAGSIANLDKRVANALDTMFTGANEVLNVLPNLRSCFNNRPNEALAIFAGIVRMGGAVIDGGEGVTSRAGNFIANLVSFVRNDQYAKVLSQINEKEYWASMSCLIETSAQAYCTAKDAYVILEDQKQLRMEERSYEVHSSDSPMRGYYLLVREIPRVSDWLQRVLIGLPPQMDAQAEFQKNVNNSYLELLNTRLSLEGRYSQKLKTYQSTYENASSDQVLQAKRAFVVDLLVELIGIMYNSGNRDSVNFFAMTVPDTIAPFVLLGIDIPPELTKADTVMNWQKYLSVNLNTFPALANPDDTILRIKTNMDELLQSVMSTGAVYYATWYIPDATRVVDEAVSIEPPNILQSLKNINSYIDQSIRRYLTDWESKKAAVEVDIQNLTAQLTAGNRSVLPRLNRKKKLREFYNSTSILPSLYETRIRITKVLKIFEEREKNFALEKNSLEKNFVALKTQEEIDEYYSNLIEQMEDPNSLPNLVMNTLNVEKSKSLKEMDQQILRVAFDEFNVLLQRDTFLFNRFYNYILTEYMERVQDGNEQNVYLRDLLAVTGRNLINRFISINRLNPNSTSLDLAQAQPINLENLEAIEQLLAKDLKVSVCKITLRIGGSEEQMEDCACIIQSNGETNKPTGWGRICMTERFLSSGSNVKKLLKGDDEFNSFAQLKAKYCIQALSFPTRWSEFKTICAGSTMISQFSDEAKMDDVQVDASFSHYAEKFATADKSSDRICALRDYIRRNQVYWLLNKQVY